MKIVRYRHESGEIQYARLFTDGGELERLIGDPFTQLIPTYRRVTPTTLLAPIQPTCIYAVGLNYRQHIGETNSALPQHPVIFMKAPSAVQHPGAPIVLPRHLRSDRVDFEVELAVIIGRECKNVPPQRALENVLGYCVANDVSARDWQREWGGGQFCRGKTFDTFCPLGPALVTADEVPDPQALTLRTTLNGEVMQESSTAQMIFPVAQIISFLSGSTTLMPGTVILTGTPEGVGMARNPPRYLQPGDTITCEIDGFGKLTNPVIEELR